MKPPKIVRQYYARWRSFDAPCWSHPLIPEDLSVEDTEIARKEAAALPERFYERTALPVITPQNVDAFVSHMSQELDLTQLNVQLWSWFSGTGRLARTMLEKRQVVLIPIDLRYGWNLQNPQVQQKLKALDQLFQPLITSMEPR